MAFNKIMHHFLSVLCLCLFLAVRVVNCDMISSCSQTPYPEICDSIVGSSPPSTRYETNPLEFRGLALQANMDHAKRAHQLLLDMDLSALDERGKLAWADCVNLSENTMNHLSSSLTSTDPTSFQDAQTWLSAAIANLQTCRNGFTEANLGSQLDSLPLMSTELSKFLCNSLAINKAAVTSVAPTSTSTLSSNSGGDRRRLLATSFPKWVSGAARKLLQISSIASLADVVVAQDGSGNYRTISGALSAYNKPRGDNKRFLIYVKAGVYQENVQINYSMTNVMLIGDGIDSTVVTGNRSFQDGLTTYRTATFAVIGDGFFARDITFENAAGAEKLQAVALRSDSDHSVFYRCSFKGYQDTLYVHSQRQFYRDCDIYGTVDFIFGDAAAVFQNCNIYARKPIIGQMNTVTAHARVDANENTGISVHNSRVIAAPELIPVQGLVKTYLGRPWGEYSRTVFIKTYLDDLIDPAGWIEWNGTFALSTLYYGEYMNIGNGAGAAARVKWPGFHVINDPLEAQKFTASDLLIGNSWIPASAVPYTSGL